MKNKRLLKRTISLVLSALILLSSITAFAGSTASIASDPSAGEDTAQGVKTEYETVSPENTQSYGADVYLTVDTEEVLVFAPKKAIISGTIDPADKLYKGYYSVEVQGDFPGNKAVSVVPDNELTLTQSGKDDITATVTQDKTEFTYSDIVNGTNTGIGVIATDKLSPGSWHGVFNINLALVDYEKSVVPDGYALLYAYDLSATEADDVNAYYCVPNKNTSPVEIETGSTTTGSMNLLSSITSLFKPITAYAAENNVIEYNGIRYELSDEDILIISGTGNMKENVSSEIADFEGLRNAVDEQFNAIHRTGYYEWLPPGTDNSTEDSKYIQYEKINSLYPMNAMDCWKYKYTNDGAHVLNWRCDGSCGTDRELVMNENPFSTKETSSHNNETLLQEVIDYIDTIKEDYIISMPKEVIIRDGVTNVSKKAFYYINTIESVTIPESVTTIDATAFSGCTALTSVNIPNGVTTIGKYAFSFCTALSEVILPDTLLTIDSFAFSRCSSLTSIDIPNSVTSIGLEALANTSIEEIYIPSSVTSLGKYLFTPEGSPTNKTLTTVVADCESISDYSFYGCSALTNVTLTDNVKSIGQRAFYSCSSLSSIAIPSSVTSIGSMAFYNCSALTTVTIPSSVTTISSSAFKNMAPGSTIYCENDAVASLLTSTKYTADNTTIVVDASKF